MESILNFDLLNRFNDITHFYTTRKGGVSVGNFSSFNLSPYSGDSTDNQSDNINILSKQTGVDVQSFVIPFQTHEDKILNIDHEFRDLPADKKSKLLSGIDALITDQREICIGITTADCVPLLFFDKNNKIIAAAHAGWRGTCAKIAKKTVQEMMLFYNSKAEDIYVTIGPSISAASYSVGFELKEEFEKAGFPCDELFSERENKLFLDLWQANLWQLIEVGIKPENIEVSGICTYLNHQNFFSARKLGIKSGRMLSGIMLK